MNTFLRAGTLLAPRTVSFPSGNGSVVGHLYLPPTYDPATRYPAVVVGGSLSSVKEMMGGNYAEALAGHGILGLAIDYRNYGESSGHLRQYEDPASKSVDLSSALKFLSSRSDVSGVGLVGVCTSGGNILYTAASDSHVGAIATVAGFFSDPAVAPTLFGGEEEVERRKTKGREAEEVYQRSGELKLVPTYSSTDKEAASISSAPYYMDENRGGGVRAWRNTFAVMSWEKWLGFDPVSKAPSVTAPALIIHSEKAAFPDQARKIGELLKGPKEIVWESGMHFDFYDDPETVRKTAGLLANHFHKSLG